MADSAQPVPGLQRGGGPGPSFLRHFLPFSDGCPCKTLYEGQSILLHFYRATLCVIFIPELRFADDMSLLAESEHDLQDLVDHLHVASSRFDLKVSNSKTELQCIGKEERK